MPVRPRLANIIAGEFERRQLAVEVLDGDVIRRNLSKPPEQPEVVVRTHNESPDESAKLIVNWFEKRGSLT